MGHISRDLVGCLVEAHYGVLSLLALFQCDVVSGIEGVKVAGEGDSDFTEANVLAHDARVARSNDPVVLVVSLDDS